MPVMRVHYVAFICTRLIRCFTTLDGLIHAVKGSEFNIKAGECLDIVDESGSGKSQTILAALRLLAPNGCATGRIIFEGQNLITADTFTLRKIRGAKIAMIFQAPLSRAHFDHQEPAFAYS